MQHGTTAATARVPPTGHSKAAAEPSAALAVSAPTASQAGHSARRGRAHETANASRRKHERGDVERDHPVELPLDGTPAIPAAEPEAACSPGCRRAAPRRRRSCPRGSSDSRRTRLGCSIGGDLLRQALGVAERRRCLRIARDVIRGLGEKAPATSSRDAMSPERLLELVQIASLTRRHPSSRARASPTPLEPGRAVAGRRRSAGTSSAACRLRPSTSSRRRPPPRACRAPGRSCLRGSRGRRRSAPRSSSMTA